MVPNVGLGVANLSVPSGSKIKAELLRLVRDNLWFADRNPDNVACIAEQMGVSPSSAVAYLLTEQIVDEFIVTPR